LRDIGRRIVRHLELAGDPLSFLSVNPTWTPTVPGRKPGKFTLSDVFNFGSASSS
jgi:hypothetical protein